MRAYAEILRVPGALAFCVSGFWARSGGAMMGVGTVLMVSGLYGSYELAGLITAVNSLGWALGTAILANLVDKHGQRKIGLPGSIISGAFIVLLITLATLHAPGWTLAIPAFCSGFSSGSPGALVRARWSHVLDSLRQVHTAFSLESALDEISMVVGPVLATALATMIAPQAGLVAVVTICCSGSIVFYSKRDTEPPPAPRRLREGERRLRRPVLLLPGVFAVFLVTVLAGVLNGSIQVTVVASTEAWGDKPLSGVVLACFAVGSGTVGLVYGAIHWRTPLTKRFHILVCAMALGATTLYFAPNALVLAGCGFLCGLAIAPTLINGQALAQRLVPQSRLTEGLAWMSGSLGIGGALGASLAGFAVERVGPTYGFLVTVAAAVAAAALTTVSIGQVRRALPGPD
ncbi:MAG: MFS transporter [Propionibacteriaceae bacterium]|nr:MFS transporter [Propionibacteriaceae bacterium]